MLHDTVFIYCIKTPARTASRHRSPSAVPDHGISWIKQEINNVTLTLPVSELVLNPAAGSSLLIENNFQVSQKAWPRRTCKIIGTMARHVQTTAILALQSFPMHFNGRFFLWRVSSFYSVSGWTQQTNESLTEMLSANMEQQQHWLYSSMSQSPIV